VALQAVLISHAKGFFARHGVRAAARNLGWLVGEKLIRLVLNVGVGFWVARYLGPEGFGNLNFSVAVAGVAALAAELGLDGIVRRRLIQGGTDASQVLTAACVLRLTAGGVTWGLLMLWAMTGGVAPDERSLLVILSFLAFQPAMMIGDLWFQARLEARYSVWAQSIALLIAAVFRVLLVAMQAPLQAFAWVVLGEMLTAGVLLGWWAGRSGGRIRFALFDSGLAKEFLKESWPLLLSGLAVTLYLKVDILMLRGLAGVTQVGIYSAAVRLSEVWYFIPVAVSASLLPALMRARAQGARVYGDRLQRSYDLNAGLAYLVSIPLALASPWVVSAAYGAEFMDAGPVLAVHIWSSIFVFLGVARGQFLSNEGHVRFYLLATVAGLVVNVVLNLTLIPRYDGLGAAWATLVAQAVAAWLSSFCFAPVRKSAWMQTKALFVFLRWPFYVAHK